MVQLKWNVVLVDVLSLTISFHIRCMINVLTSYAKEVGTVYLVINRFTYQIKGMCLTTTHLVEKLKRYNTTRNSLCNVRLS